MICARGFTGSTKADDERRSPGFKHASISSYTRSGPGSVNSGVNCASSYGMAKAMSHGSCHAIKSASSVSMYDKPASFEGFKMKLHRSAVSPVS